MKNIHKIRTYFLKIFTEIFSLNKLSEKYIELFSFFEKLEKIDNFKFIEQAFSSLKYLQNHSDSGVFEEKAKVFFDSLEKLKKFDEKFPGGLGEYCEKIRHLLRNQKKMIQKIDPPKVFDYAQFDYDSWLDLEKKGKRQACSLGLVLLAGGMAERLEYSDVKLNIHLDLMSKKSFLQLYLQMQLAIKKHIKNFFGKEVSIPIVLVVSHATRSRIESLLEKNNFYGLDRKEIRIVEQEAYPAVKNDQAELAFDDDFCLQQKPPGHGNVHKLLWQSGALEWLSGFNVQTLVFLQDTNFQIFQHLFVVLGAFSQHHTDFAFLGVKLNNAEKLGILGRFSFEKKEVVGNVEYNLFPHLSFSAQQSEYLANTNTLLTCFDVYRQVMDSCGGDLPYFINPKYADDGKTFLKTARLEQLMQDISLFFPNQNNVHVYHFSPQFIFSAIKTRIQVIKNPPKYKFAMNAFANEQIFFATMREKLHAGGNIFYDDHSDAKKKDSFLHFCSLGKVVLPCYQMSTLDGDETGLRDCIFHPYSYLIVDGAGDFLFDNVVLHRYTGFSLYLAKGVEVIVKDIEIKNHGYDVHFFDENENIRDEQSLRGFSLQLKDWQFVSVTDPGKYLWTTEGLQKI